MIRQTQYKTIAAAAIAILACPLIAWRATAEPVSTVTITSGSLTVHGLDLLSTFALAGTQGFSFEGSWDSVPSICSPCEVGSTQLFSASLSGSPNTGTTGTFQGQTYAFDLNHGGAALTFDAPTLTFPPVGSGDVAQFTLPFKLVESGSERSEVSFQSGAAPPFEVLVRGSGTATLFTNIVRLPDFEPPFYMVKSLRYDFATPTPEPASLVLIASGLGLACWRRRGSVGTVRM